MLKDDLFPSRSLDVSQSLWQEIFWIPGLCSQTLETDALRLHWELCSGRGLICGDSLGKQFHLLAFYWKLLYRLLHVNKLYSLSANISYNNVCKYSIKAQISVTRMFANMASQKVGNSIVYRNSKWLGSIIWWYRTILFSKWWKVTIWWMSPQCSMRLLLKWPAGQ